MKLSPPTRPSEPLGSTGLAPPGARLVRAPTSRDPARSRLGLRGWYVLLVVVPTLLVGGYFYGYASNVYESEARILVRNKSGGSAGMADLAGGAGSRLSSLFPTSRAGTEEARAVTSFVDSHAAVAALREKLDVVAIWRRPEADRVSRLWWEQPEAEWLLWYYRRRVRMTLDPDTGVLVLRAQAFRPQDAQALAGQILSLSEGLVNTLAERTIADALRAGQEELARAEARVVAAREALINFREREQAFDPQRAAFGAVDNIARLEAALAQARADLQERRSFMRPDNPQVQLLQNRITALQEQILTERGRVTRGGEALTQQVAGFERLELERQLADRQLASATATLETARAEAVRQQTFVLRVAEPHMPQFALYPRAAYNTLTIFVSLSVLFGIGWLLVVSAREHAN